MFNIGQAKKSRTCPWPLRCSVAEIHRATFAVHLMCGLLPPTCSKFCNIPKQTKFYNVGYIKDCNFPLFGPISIQSFEANLKKQNKSKMQFSHGHLCALIVNKTKIMGNMYRKHISFILENQIKIILTPFNIKGFRFTELQERKDNNADDSTTHAPAQKKITHTIHLKTPTISNKKNNISRVYSPHRPC